MFTVLIMPWWTIPSIRIRDGAGGGESHCCGKRFPANGISQRSGAGGALAFAAYIDLPASKCPFLASKRRADGSRPGVVVSPDRGDVLVPRSPAGMAQSPFDSPAAVVRHPTGGFRSSGGVCAHRVGRSGHHIRFPFASATVASCDLVCRRSSGAAGSLRTRGISTKFHPVPFSPVADRCGGDG